MPKWMQSIMAQMAKLIITALIPGLIIGHIIKSIGWQLVLVYLLLAYLFIGLFLNALFLSFVWFGIKELLYFLERGRTRIRKILYFLSVVNLSILLPILCISFLLSNAQYMLIGYYVFFTLLPFFLANAYGWKDYPFKFHKTKELDVNEKS